MTENELAVLRERHVCRKARRAMQRTRKAADRARLWT